MIRKPLFLLLGTLLFFICLHLMTTRAPGQNDWIIVNHPPKDIGEATLYDRRKAQLQQADQVKAFHDFWFVNKVTESGITFKHQMVDDAGKRYKPVHYDHGNGIAVADVDGDGLYDIYLLSQLGNCELWKNLGGGKFKNITAEAGVALKDRITVTASFADTDNDGDPDLYVTTVRMGNVFFENDGKGRFTDITKQSGLSYSGHSSGAVFFDYNLDGLLDLFLCNVGKYTTDQKGAGGYYVGLADGFVGHLHPERTEYKILYKNAGKNRFVDVSTQVGLRDGSWSGDASATDFNQDRYPDLYVLNMQGDNHYYENQKGKSFVDKTATFFPKTPWGAMGIKFFDYNNDGFLDLLLTDMHSDMSQEVGPDKEKLKSVMIWKEETLQGSANNIFGNAFYKNDGAGKFQEVSDQIGVENYWPWGPSIGDINSDGYEDIFITAGMSFPYRYGINSLLLNEKGEVFRDTEFILGVEPRKDGQVRTFWFDLDCSGDDKDAPMCQGQTRKLKVMATLSTRSAVIFDLDNDGDLDIVTNEFNSQPQVFISNLAARKKDLHYLGVKLIGKTSNKNGLGALVKVFVGPATYTRYNDGKSGYLSHSDLPLYFGLGRATKVDRVEVLWPSGIQQVIKDGIQLNTTITVEETGQASQ